MESIARSEMSKNAFYAKCQRTLVRPRTKLARSPVASATNGVYPKFAVPKDVNPLLTPYQLGPFDLSHRIVLAPLTRCRALGEKAHMFWFTMPFLNLMRQKLFCSAARAYNDWYITSRPLFSTCPIMQGRCRRSMLQNTMLNVPPKAVSSYLRPHAYQSQDMGKRFGHPNRPLLLEMRINKFWYKRDCHFCALMGC